MEGKFNHQKEKLAVYNVTASDMKEAQKISKKLVEQRLAPCCTIVGRVTSFYEKKGDIQEEGEVLMTFKSRESLCPLIVEAVEKEHSYDTPEVTAVPIIAGSEKYCKWVLENTRDPL